MRIYSLIGQLFTYPSGDYSRVVQEVKRELEPYGISDASGFAVIADHFTRLSCAELQEYYIRTFDVNASCFLDIGYVLFGEESKRGQFLLNMKQEQLKAGNPCGTEFADHLPNVLSLLPNMTDPIVREELVVTLMIPALKHMAGNFRTEGNVYLNLLSILVSVLEANFRESRFEPYVINQNEIDCAGAYACGMEFTKQKSRKY